MTDMKQPGLQQRTVAQGKVKMTPSEAFVETLVAQGVTDVFGIVGSAFMDALDIFPAAGIRFIPVAHEQGAAHMADGYSRVSGRHGVCIAQNGPGHHQFRDRHRGSLLGSFPGGVHHAGDRLDDDRPGRLPGDRAAADLLEDHQAPVPRHASQPHGRAHQPCFRPRPARDGAGAGEHPARFLLRRKRDRDPEAAPHRARPGRRAGARRGGAAAGAGEVPGDPRRRRRHHGRQRPRRRWSWQNCCTRRSPAATCTTIRSRRRTRCGAGRWGTRAPRRR